MSKFNIGDTVRITRIDGNVSTLTNKLKECEIGGVYDLDKWEEKIFCVCSNNEEYKDFYGNVLPVYLLSHKGQICGYVYEEVLQKVKEEDLINFYLHWESPEKLPKKMMDDYLNSLPFSEDVLVDTENGYTVGYYDFTKSKWCSNLDIGMELKVLEWTYIGKNHWK